METVATRVSFDGSESLVVPDGCGPVWVKIGRMTLQITEYCGGAIVDAWRNDDDSMAEPWTVEFDGSSAEIR